MKAAIRFDGGSRGNPGESACGYIVEIDGASFEGGDYLGVKTNNQAEYSGLVNALSALIERADPSSVDLTIYADSELVVKQIKGLYKARNANILPLYQESKMILGRFKSYKIEHVPREKNVKCDGIVNRILDSRKKR